MLNEKKRRCGPNGKKNPLKIQGILYYPIFINDGDGAALHSAHPA